ncbi:MAG: BLUF domain-containing protein [Rhodocyclaceae bacterium]|mgnify:FL=1
MLVRLLYASRAVASLTTENVDSILEESRSHNVPHGITGMLCFSNDLFIQVLEGSRKNVSDVYNRIVKDKRHSDIQLLIFEEIAERRFGNWTMGQVNLARVNPSLLLKYSETPVINPFACSGRATLALLDELIANGAVIGRAP